MGESSWIAIVVAICAAIPGIMAALHQRRKEKTDATDTLIQTALNLVKSVKEDADRHAQENAELRRILQDEQNLVELLKAKLEEAGIKFDPEAYQKARLQSYPKTQPRKPTSALEKPVGKPRKPGRKAKPTQD